ncbi:MAG: hypothetical protein PWQ37_317 [Candidatus Petromonas sp.]|jgi:GT2 family glycosyltransferase/2-polyprenyl-3-methyl-5-hydroxy-6-metoxy-1,4-benzoquinol methylase|nr:hypothetical protein [Candidatus Petromonas sp.]
MSENTLYNKNYYKYHLGLEYSKEEKHWHKFFGSIADRIIKEFNPRTVLDAGCAKGFLVEALRDRGVEAYGIDISEHAISQVREDIKPYCKVASILDPLDRKYDLIISIEVLEHLTEYEGIRAIENLCNHTEHIIFSSTPEDIEEFTHVNVRPMDYWVKLFALNGFIRDLDHDMSYISPQAMKFTKLKTSFVNSIQEYDRGYNRLKNENKIIRNSNIILNQKVDELTNQISKKFISKLYIDNGDGFNEKNCIVADYNIKYKELYYDLENIKYIKSLRWDPMENQFCKLEINEIKLIYKNNSKSISMESIKHNGLETDGGIIFYTLDPQIFIENVNSNNIQSLKIKANIKELDRNLIENKILELESNIKSLKDNIASKEEEIQEKEQKIISLDNSVSILKQDKEKQNKKIDKLLIEKQILKDNIAKLNSDIDNYKLQLSNIEAKLQIHKEFNSELKAELRNQLEENKRLNKKIFSIENNKTSTVKKLKTEIKELTSKLTEKINIEVKLRNNINSLKRTIEDLENENKKLNNTLEEIFNSDSWRITKPLRIVGRNFKKILEKKVRIANILEEVELVTDNPNIAVHIDEYKIIGNIKKQLTIKGWAFNQLGEKIKIEIILPKNKPINLDWHNREDVFRAFDCKFDNALKSGFVIKIENLKAKDIVTFRIGNDINNDYKEYNVSVKNILKSQKAKKIAKYIDLFAASNLKKTISYCRKYGIKNTLNKISYKLKCYSNEGYNHQEAYERWIQNNENYNIGEVLKEIKEFKYKPKISIIMPVYNVEEKWLRKCIYSVINQYYRNWELCIADDNSTKPHIKPLLKEYMKKDNRIKVVFRQENGHISRASNSALKIATGEFIALLDNDDELAPFALYEVVKLLNKYPDADLIYSDEDKIDGEGNRKDPHFKPDWSPDTFMSLMYTCHLGVYRKKIVDEIGGFRVGFEGAQDYDLVLRLTEKTNKIYHIPKILYHWRVIQGSTAMGIEEKNYAYEAGYRALTDALRRRHINGVVEKTPDIPHFNVVYSVDKDTFISIIIPTRDYANVLDNCLKSIYEKTTFKKYEVIVVDNGSSQQETFELFRKYKTKYNNFRVLRLDIPFNFSKLNNEAVKISEGNLLLFLNNDTEVITPEWLELMAGYAQRKHIAAVGAKLYYPDDTIQHAGVILGIARKAGHAYVGCNKNDIGYFARLKLVYNYSAVTGACMMMRKEVFEELGCFDEKLEVAFNDIDLCIKAISKGYYNVLIPNVELYHHESKSRGYEDTPEKIIRFDKETKYLRDKWGKIIDNDPFYNPNLLLDNSHFFINSKEPIEYKL